MHIPKKLKESNGIEAIKTVSMLGRHLPLEIIAESLSYLDPNDLLSCALVCRQFSAPAIASLWRVIPLADLCDFATYPGSLPSPKSDDHKTVVKPQNHLNNHARLVEIGPGVEQLMVTRFALPLQENVLRQIPDACPRLDKIRFFHDPAVFDPSDEEYADEGNAYANDPLSRIRLYQHDDNHVLDSHVETILSHLGSRLKGVSFEGILGLTGASLEALRKFCPNLEYLRIRFCLDESASDALGKLLQERPNLQTLIIVELRTSLFNSTHLLQTSRMKHLRMLNIDTDGSKSTITSSHTKTIDLSCFPALSSFWLSRTHGGYEAPVVSPVLSALNHLTDLYMTCSLDPIADALAVCGNTLRRLRIVTVIRGDPKSEEQRRASDKGLESLGKSLKSLVTFHLFLTPPDTNDDIYIPIVDNKIPITNRGVLALAKGCKDLKVLSLRAGRPLELSGITDECLEGLLDLKLSLTELRLDPVNINFTKLLSTPSGRNLKFPRLQVVEFGNHHENFATKEGMTLFIDRFCPRLASFRYNDGEYERDFCKAAETGLSFWYGWEDMDETGEEEEN